ncbi:hypothetical protein GCM10020229_13950 [Kitasatospora albolonga]|uniref:caspase, EACC1-associated type n=1 Tax=Kitasatospora albolonga TaxID=68173 RepID=UPI0031EA596D
MTSWTLTPDRADSWAVLVAVGTYAGLPPMPEAVASMELLADHLAGPDGSFAPERVVRLADPRSPGEVLDRIADAAGRARSTVLLYFAGHGVTSAEGRLHLALPGTEDDPERVPGTALSAEAALAALGQGAAHRIAVLDCCFAGLALDEPAAADLHLLTAVDRDRRALLNEELGLTRFAEELLRLLREGVPDGPADLPLDLIHHHLAVELAQVPDPVPSLYRPPVPMQRAVDGSGHLALARNPAHGTALTATGLRARAGFAARQFAVRQYRRPWHQPQAAARLAAIAADAAAVLGPADLLTLQLRTAHADAVGSTEGGEAALALLRPLAALAAAILPAGSPVLATVKESLARWQN